MSQTITLTYHGVLVVYDEKRNRWVFEIDGKERSAESLENAKKAIEAPERKTKAPFKRIPCIYKTWRGGYTLYVDAEITSFAETSYGARTEVWISFKSENKAQRQKVRIYELIAKTADNQIRLDNLASLEKEIAGLLKQQQAIMDSLTKMKLPATL